MRRIFLFALLGLCGAKQLARQKRQARANVQSCTVSPSGADDPLTPANENEAITITCNTDTVFDVCIVQHIIPMNVGQSQGGTYQDDEVTKCVGDLEKNGLTCTDDPRLTYVMSSNQCGVRISRTEPDDTGKWIFTVSEYSGNTGSGQDNSKTITVYTYNRTLIDFTDDRDAEITRDIDVWFNYDDNEEEWRSGTGGWESVEINCNARGGRPEPAITWMVNDDDRNAFGEEVNNDDADNIFNTRDTSGATYDDEGYIQDKVSQLTFDIDRDLMAYLENNHGIDVNPSSGEFSFDLSCDADQGDYGNDRITTTINVKRVYFEDKLKASTIGWIVGGVLVGVLLILILAVTVWAKAAGRLCFEDSEYSYGNPNDPKRRPRTQPQR